MYAYYVVYEDPEKTDPVGIFVRELGQSHAMLWDHRAKAWIYDSRLVGRFLTNSDNDDTFQEVDRATAEQITPAVTGGEGLPDEETIAWIFTWEGRPPQG